MKLHVIEIWVVQCSIYMYLGLLFFDTLLGQNCNQALLETDTWLKKQNNKIANINKEHYCKSLKRQVQTGTYM